MQQTNWPKFAGWMLAVEHKEVCGKLEDFVFGSWEDACKLPYNHDGPCDWQEVKDGD